MSAPTLDRATARIAAVPQAPPPPAARPVERSRPSDRRIVLAALLLSLLVHALAFLLIRFDFQFRLTPNALPQDGAADRLMHVVDVTEVTTGTTAETPPKPELEVASPPVTETAPPVTVVPLTPPPARDDAAPPPARDRSMAERLGPRMSDPRLWTGPTTATAPSTRLDEARLALGSRIAAYNDSLRAAEDAAARQLDWTVEDADGKKWGISPGKLHLGSITLPLPLQFSAPADRRDELNRRLSDWSAIQLQRLHADAQATIKERAKEIRERKASADTSKTGG